MKKEFKMQKIQEELLKIIKNHGHLFDHYVDFEKRRYVILDENCEAVYSGRSAYHAINAINRLLQFNEEYQDSVVEKLNVAFGSKKSLETETKDECIQKFEYAGEEYQTEIETLRKKVKRLTNRNSRKGARIQKLKRINEQLTNDYNKDCPKILRKESRYYRRNSTLR